LQCLPNWQIMVVDKRGRNRCDLSPFPPCMVAPRLHAWWRAPTPHDLGAGWFGAIRRRAAGRCHRGGNLTIVGQNVLLCCGMCCYVAQNTGRSRGIAFNSDTLLQRFTRARPVNPPISLPSALGMCLHRRGVSVNFDEILLYCGRAR
jgi:hypothetical protein